MEDQYTLILNDEKDDLDYFTSTDKIEIQKDLDALQVCNILFIRVYATT